MTVIQTIKLELEGKEIDLQVEEWVPFDSAAFQYGAGWSCFDPITGIEYFVSGTGGVYQQPENTVVGVAPEIKAKFDKDQYELEQYAKQYEEDQQREEEYNRFLQENPDV